MRLNSVVYNKVMQRKASNSTFYLRTDQLCLSNEQVLKLTLKTLEQYTTGTHRARFSVEENVRFLKVSAVSIPSLPAGKRIKIKSR